MIVENGSRRYVVGELVAKMASFRLYLCLSEGDQRQCLLQIASIVEDNGVLDRAAYLLGLLYERSQEIEAEYEKVREKPGRTLHYERLFPELIDSFVLASQGGRRVNMLGFRDVPDTRQLVPLSNIVQRDRHRVDLKTSVWIMGRLLKSLVFVHDQGITVGNITSRNILIEPDNHFLVVLDWTQAQQHPDGIPSADVREDIMSAARSVIEVLGGSVETGIPNDGTEAFVPYSTYLQALARDGQRSAVTAHTEFYALVDGLWPRGFHPFTSYPL